MKFLSAEALLHLVILAGRELFATFLVLHSIQAMQALTDSCPIWLKLWHQVTVINDILDKLDVHVVTLMPSYTSNHCILQKAFVPGRDHVHVVEKLSKKIVGTKSPWTVWTDLHFAPSLL